LSFHSSFSTLSPPGSSRALGLSYVLRSGRFAPAVAVGLTLGGIVGTFAAFPLVKMLGAHLMLMRWVVTVVIAYAAIAMLRSAREHTG
jgi:multisubunit Na+/H+ antiporter MnhE subunit